MTISTSISINGEDVDINEPCDVATALRKAQLRLATGGNAVEVEIDGERVRYASSNDARLTALISEYTTACEVTKGKAGRRRKHVRWS